MQLRNYNPSIVTPVLHDVMGRLGYNPKKTDLDDQSKSLVQQGIALALSLQSPKGLSLDAAITEWTEREVHLDCGLKLTSEKLAAVLKGCQTVSIMACTIGEEIKKKVDELITSGDYAIGVTLDAAASESVEALAELITGSLIREKKLLGLAPTMRFSPGYGDWETDVQPEILKTLQASGIGLTADPESNILNPEKSITAVIGWRK